MKKGRWASTEYDFVKDNYRSKSAEEIADKLDRPIEAVELLISKYPREPENAKEIKQDLKNSEAWKNLSIEFSETELLFFEEAYVKFIAQFEGNVLASEETQIFQAIKFDILMHRNLKDQKKAKADIERIEKLQEGFIKKFGNDSSNMSDSDKNFLLQLETQLNIARSAGQGRANEFVKLQECHGDLLKSLKSTREQRIKQIETGKLDFLQIIKNLEIKENQERESRYMELMNIAGNTEYKRLSKLTKYEDGSEDSPILSADTLEFLDEENLNVEE